MMSKHALPGADDITRVELPNGIVVLARPNPESPSVVLSGYLNGGSLNDPLDRLGLSAFTAMSLMRGTQQHKFQEIFDALESAGATLGFGSSVHSINFGGRALAEDLPLLLSYLSECMRYPVFPPEHVERLRAQVLTGLAIRAQETEEMASLRFDQIVFPNHPYGRPVDGFIETIQPITREEMLTFHRQFYGPRGMVLAVVGGLRVEEMVEQVQRALGDWQNPQQQQVIDLDVPVKLEAPAREHIAIPGKTQVNVVMGTLGPRRNSPDFMPASLGNSVLGQFGMMGRIGDVVREQAGLAYHASTDLSVSFVAGSWVVSAGVNPDNVQRAIDLIVQELEKFVSEPVTAEELSDSKSYYIGRLPLTMESNGGVAGSLLNVERFQLGLDYYRQYRNRVEEVTPEQILETAQKYIDPHCLAVVSAGTLNGNDISG
jgi:zinc protease